MSASTTTTDPTRNNRNPTGKNQYKDCPPKNDARVTELLYEYQRRQVFDKKKISQLLYSEHGIKLSESSVARRRRALGLHASGATTRQLPETVKRQLVQTQMDRDPGKKLGPRMIKQLISKETGIHLTREYIRGEMFRLDPEGFVARDTSKRTRLATLESDQPSVASPTLLPP